MRFCLVAPPTHEATEVHNGIPYCRTHLADLVESTSPEVEKKARWAFTRMQKMKGRSRLRRRAEFAKGLDRHVRERVAQLLAEGGEL